MNSCSSHTVPVRQRMLLSFYRREEWKHRETNLMSSNCTPQFAQVRFHLCLLCDYEKCPLSLLRPSRFEQQIISTYQCPESGLVRFKVKHLEGEPTPFFWGRRLHCVRFPSAHFSLHSFESALRREHSVYREVTLLVRCVSAWFL